MNNSSLNDTHPYESILLIRVILFGFTGCLLSLFGIVGNLITILILLSRSMRHTSTNIYLISLSCSNIIYLIVFILSDSLLCLIEYYCLRTDKHFGRFHRFLKQIPFAGLHYSSLFSIIYLTIAVSIDRLIFLQYPFIARRILTKQRTRKIILFIYLSSLVYSFPLWFSNMKLKKLHKYIQIYISTPLLYIVPLIILTLINIQIILNLVERKNRQIRLLLQHNRYERIDNYIILILATTTIIFNLCQIPFCILNTWYALDPSSSFKTRLFSYILIFAILLFVLNTSTSFAVHCLLGKQFREILCANFRFTPSNLRLSSVNQKQMIVTFKKETHTTTI